MLLFKALASLKLTVALLAMSMALTFLGTLAQARMGVWQTVEAYFRSPVAWVELQLLVPQQVAQVPGAIPIPGGLTLGALILINLLAAHAMRFRFHRRRIGVIVLHLGLIVLLAGEAVTAWFAHEGLMSIDVGGTANYVEDVRTVEMAVIDASDPEHDRVVSIPVEHLRRAARSGEPITHESLPFDVDVVQWHENARLLRATGPTPASRGVGLSAKVDPLPRVRGVDGAATDAPAAYVRLLRNGEDLGTWLLWANLIDPQPVKPPETVNPTGSGQAGGVTDLADISVSLRYRRTYKPYTLELLEFRHDKFVGTEIPRNFSSRVRLIDPERHTDREVVIWMNHPLRYRGATFYQASYKPDGSGTVLQVVRNPGAWLPYVACGLVGGGMLLHFGMLLVGFLRRRGKRARQTGAIDPAADRGPWWFRLTPWIAGAVGLAITGAGQMRPLPDGPYDLRRFASLPVSAGGRIKPMDSAARHALMVAGGRQAVRSNEGVTDATSYLLGLMARPGDVRDLPVVRVDHPDVLELIGLTPEQGGRVSLDAIEPHWAAVSEQAFLASEVDSKQRDPFQQAVLRLYHGVNTLLAHARMREPYAIPPLGPDQPWRPFHDAFLEHQRARESTLDQGAFDNVHAMHPAVAYYVAMMTAYSEEQPDAFNRSVAGYDALLRDQMPGVMRMADLEVWFNRMAPFVGATAVYVLALVLVCLAMLWRLRPGEAGLDPPRGETLRRAAVGLLVAALIVHTLAILVRMQLQGRPPVTNLYSSAVFVGWAAVLVGLWLERLYPLGVAALGASVIGFTTLIIAHNLGSDGDTLEMMQAVLDSNFWLATHVIVITLGYAATFLAGALATIYLLLGLCTRRLSRDRAEALARMVYGVVCFALLLSFVGTVLGGIWADQSWGRFWGWDPKENGAVLVVLINAVILHARWGGMIRHRGMMVLAVAGNIVTAWSWFGTNMLGVGLHAYGFMDSAVFWLLLFVASQLLLMAAGLLPMNLWRSPAPSPGAAARQPS